MRKISILIFFIMLVTSFTGIFSIQTSIAKPTTIIIVWRFDDISIRSNDIKINKFVSMTKNVTKYGGYVGWGFIPGSNETIQYPHPQNLTYKQKNIEKFNTLTSDEKVFLWLHCWNHSWWTGNNGPSVWTKSIEKQRKALNYTIWTFYNNFGYYPPIFSAGGSKGNIDTTIVLAERDILLLYGNSNYEPPDERLRYLTLPSDENSVLLQLNYYDSLENMKTKFTDKYNNYPILQVLLHPGDWSESKLPVFAEFTEWVYTNHVLVNMNFTDAYNYKHELETTPSSNQPPVFGTPSPANGSIGNPLDFTWSIPIYDLEGNVFDWTIQCSNGQGNIATGTTNGTKTLALSGLAYSTTYKVWVNATDPAGSGLYSSRTYKFTTQSPSGVLDQQQTQYINKIALYSTRWSGQSFIPTLTLLTRAKVYIKKVGGPSSAVVLSVRSSRTGTDLVSVSKPASQISTSFSWVEFDFSDLSVNPGTTYYLILRTTGGTSSNCYYWRYGSNTPYKNGMRWYSTNSGVSWTSYAKNDFCFKTYGI